MQNKPKAIFGSLAIALTLVCPDISGDALAKHAHAKTRSASLKKASLKVADTTGKQKAPGSIPENSDGNALSRQDRLLVAVGKASYYGNRFHGRTTAAGQPFDKKAFTAAHRSLPFGTLVRVTNLSNGKMVFVTINDRGPYIKNRIIDISKAAAIQLGLVDCGIGKVRIEAYN
ncbi:MAG: septal ring lytic transglycosylase RlpA family protein [Chlorobiaceae bacterium]|nr:septal ring lytic transglycosylase RlpA family protein [Chlorobiaceae bacterium]